MKQKITTKQISELSFAGENNLHNWAYRHGYRKRIVEKGTFSFCLPLLTIGQMIEFMDDQGNFGYSKQFVGSGNTLYWVIREKNKKENKFKSVELCDTLWKAVKQVLEK